MKKKELYEAPSVETYDLVPEDKVLTLSAQGNTIDDAEQEEWQEYL